jgi:predicted ATPase
MISYLLGALGLHNLFSAIEMIVEILAQFGLNFPKRKWSIARSTKAGTRKAIRKMSSLRPEDISNLPMMEDPVHLEMMSLLDQLFTATYMSASDLMPLTIFARIRLTLAHGLCEYSALAFAGLALLLRNSDDPALASKTGSFAQLAMTIVDCKNRDTKAGLWLNAFVFCWTDPLTRMMPRLLKGYETGLPVGDTENALWVSTRPFSSSL